MTQTNRYISHVNHAINIASTKACHRQHKMAVLIIRGGAAVAIGWNKSYKHAEHMALDRAYNVDLTNTLALVIRIRKDGTLAMAKPCGPCMDRLIEAGVKKLVYSNNEGELEHVRLYKREVSHHIEYHYLKRGFIYKSHA